MVCLSKPYVCPFKFFKGCLPQIPSILEYFVPYKSQTMDFQPDVYTESRMFKITAAKTETLRPVLEKSFS